MLKIEIDGKQVEVADGTTIIDAADQLGVAIPRFCYHKKWCRFGFSMWRRSAYPFFIERGICRSRGRSKYRCHQPRKAP